MKTIVSITLLAVFGAVAAEVVAPPKYDPPKTYKPAKPSVVTVKTEVTVTTEAPASAPAGQYVYDQKPLPGYPALVSREQADAVVAKFREAYPKLGSPRMLIYVNRDLVDAQSGVRMTTHSVKTETTENTYRSTVEAPANQAGSLNIQAGRDVHVGGSRWEFPGKGDITRRETRTVRDDRYQNNERKFVLADRQTVRDVERLFGRPLRAAGAALADQETAVQLIANRPLQQMLQNTEGEQARKDRDTLAKISDVVLEVLISSRQMVVPEVSGDKVYTVPDIQATAVRLSDSRIIGQASSRDVTGKDRYAGRIVRNFDVQEIAEATALALMEDMAMGAR